jgi:hypothetical protein
MSATAAIRTSAAEDAEDEGSLEDADPLKDGAELSVAVAADDWLVGDGWSGGSGALVQPATETTRTAAAIVATIRKDVRRETADCIR